MANALIIGTSSGIYRSTDSGSTWSQVSSVPATVCSTSLSNLYGLYGSGIYQSTDGGNTWVDSGNKTPIATATGLLISTADSSFLNGDRTGGTHTIAKSSDQGSSWTTTNASYSIMYGLANADGSVDVMTQPGSYSYYIKSLDNGSTWSAAASLPNPSMGGFINANQLPISVCNLDGTTKFSTYRRVTVQTWPLPPPYGTYYGYALAKSTNGGGTWSVIQSSVSPDVSHGPSGLFGACYCEGSTVLYFSNPYTMRRSTDLGLTWEPKITTPANFTVFTKIGSILYGLGEPFYGYSSFSASGNYYTSGLYASNDLGSTWNPVFTSAVVSSIVEGINEIPIVVDFVGVPVLGVSPLTVQFTDQSTGLINSWLWNFGDGGSSTEQNPIYTYLSPGKYTVSLLVDYVLSPI